MKCSRHGDRDAVAQCQNCGAYICSDCAKATKSARESRGTLCVNCYVKALEEVKAKYIRSSSKHVPTIVISAIMYIIGLIIIIVAATSANEGVEKFMIALIGIAFCGFYTAIIGFSTAFLVMRKHLIMAIIIFAVCLLLGIVVTPINAIRHGVNIKKDKQHIANINDLIKEAQKV